MDDFDQSTEYEEVATDEDAEAAFTRRGLVRRAVGGGFAALGATALLPTATAFAQGSAQHVAETHEASIDPATRAVFQKLFPSRNGGQPGKGTTLQVGQNLAMTGSGAFYGRVMSRGAALASKQIAAFGGPNLHMDINDHKGITSASVLGVSRLISLNHIHVLETSYAAPTEALIPNLQRNKILTFNGGGASPGQVGKDFIWQTRMLLGWDSMPGALAWIHETYPTAKRVAVIGTLENGVEGYRKKLPVQWPKLVPGGTIVDTEVHNVGETNFGPFIDKIKATNPDFVYSFSFGNDLGYQIKQFRDAGFNKPILGNEFTTDAYRIAGKAMDHGYFFAYDFFDTNNQNPLTKQFVASHKKAYGVLPEFYGANYYEITLIIWELIRRVVAKGGDPNSGAALQAALKSNPTFPSVYGGGKGKVGTMTFAATDHSVSKPMGVYQVNNGVVQLLQFIKRVPFAANPKSALVGAPVRRPTWKPS